MPRKSAPAFKLRFAPDRISYWAGRYEYRSEEQLLRKIGPAARTRGYLTRKEFLQVCDWKTVRTRSRCARNSASYVKEATRAALAARSDRLGVEVLTLLDGVSFPTASTILHFCARRDYPIIDYRALWTLQCPVPSKYTFDLYGRYTEFFRGLMSRTGAGRRELDRALWQFSKERQPPE